MPSKTICAPNARSRSGHPVPGERLFLANADQHQGGAERHRSASTRASSRDGSRRVRAPPWGSRSATEHAATISGTSGVGSTNSIGTKMSWSEPSTRCRPDTERGWRSGRQPTVTTRAHGDSEHAVCPNTASAPATIRKIAAAPASVRSRRRARPVSRVTFPAQPQQALRRRGLVGVDQPPHAPHRWDRGQPRFHGSMNTSSTRTLPVRVVSTSETSVVPPAIAAGNAELVSISGVGCHPPNTRATPAGR